MMGLVVQPKLAAEAGKARRVRADLTGEEFEAAWRAVPLWLRLAIYAAAPLVGLHRRWFSSRNRLMRDMACEDQTPLSELLAITPETGALTQAVLHAPLGASGRRVRYPPPKKIAVVYGAAHMRAVVRELTANRASTVSDARWRTLMNVS
jgi:hypothetical protein